jgi:hypothetical protein
MKQQHLIIALFAALSLGITSADIIAGKGGGGAGSGRSGGGMPGMGMSGDMSKGVGAGGGMKGAKGAGTPGVERGVTKGKADDSPFLERHRVGEKDDVGVRTREADMAR